MSKRKRDPTFAASEKMALIELVEKYFHIVESKKTDAVSVRDKIDQWHKIADEFNSISSINPRDWAVLKNCWENLKKRAKTEQTSRNQHFLGTGGGPPKKSFVDPATERVLELIHSRVTGYINCYDSDGTRILASCSNASDPPQEAPEYVLCLSDTNISGSQLLQTVETPEPVAESTETANTLTVDWSQYTPNMLRGSRNPALARPQSPSPDVQLCVDQPPQQIISTPPRAHVEPVAVAATSRRRPRRPEGRERETQSLNLERVNTLIKANVHAEEEHKLKMNILKIQQEKEEEILKQEKLKTKQEEIKLEILNIQLRKLKE